MHSETEPVLFGLEARLKVSANQHHDEQNPGKQYNQSARD
jgi:hypothetical protein